MVVNANQYTYPDVPAVLAEHNPMYIALEHLNELRPHEVEVLVALDLLVCSAHGENGPTVGVCGYGIELHLHLCCGDLHAVGEVEHV